MTSKEQRARAKFLASTPSPPYSIPWLVKEEAKWIAEGFRAMERLLAAHAAFERFYEERRP